MWHEKDTDYVLLSTVWCHDDDMLPYLSGYWTLNNLPSTSKRPRCDTTSEDLPLTNTGTSTVYMLMCFIYMVSSTTVDQTEAPALASGTSPPESSVSQTESNSQQRVDIGDIILGRVQLKNLSEHELYCYLKNHSVLKKEDLIKQEVVKGSQQKKKTLVFQFSWLDKFKWLAYSSVAKGGFCNFCILFLPVGTVRGNFVTVPFTNLQKACGKDGKLLAHSRLQYHKPSYQPFSILRGAFNTAYLSRLVNSIKPICMCCPQL